MKASTDGLNTWQRSNPASPDSEMNAHFDLVPLLLAESQFQDLSEYMSLARGFVSRKQQDFSKRVDSYIAVNLLDGEDKDEYYSSHEDDYDQLHSRFPRIIFSSTLLMACSLFESSLVDLCKALERAVSTPTPWSDVKGKGITRAAAFLRKNYRICLANYSRWNHVTNHFKVRDCIVHADGDLSNMQKDQAAVIRVLAKPYEFLGFRINNRHIEIEQQFVSAAIDDLGGIWPLLEDACVQNEVVGPHYWP